MKKTIILSALSTLVLMGCQSEDSNVKDTTNARANDITQTKRELALELSEHYSEVEPLLRKEITAQDTSVAVSEFAEEKPSSTFSRQLVAADDQIRSWKGITEYADQILEVRLANPAMLSAWQQGEIEPLFAFEPSGDDEQWQFIEAYDVYGQVHQLDVYQLPDIPVLVVDSNSSAELKAGLQVMQAEMNKLGQATRVQPFLSGRSDDTTFSAYSSDEVAPIHTTQLKKIRLANDQEPWISGKAEIYALVTGVNPSRDEPALDLVELPYLDYDNQDYYPNQIMIHWSRYRWGAADIVIMEQDDGTDYKKLASLLVQVAEEVLKAIPDPEVQAYAIIPQITNKIIAAIPDGVLTNDDDFVDVYYTIMQDTSYVDHPGAGVNAVVTLEPLTINPTRP